VVGAGDWTCAPAAVADPTIAAPASAPFWRNSRRSMNRFVEPFDRAMAGTPLLPLIAD